MTHKAFLRQLVLLDALPQALLTLYMRESIKLSDQGRSEMATTLQQQYTQYKQHQQRVKAAFIVANSSHTL